MSSRKGFWLRTVAVLALVLLLFAACGEEAADVTSAGGGDETEMDHEFSTLEEGVLKVGSCLDYKPFEYFEKGSKEPTGFDVELTEAIAQHLGLEVEWVKANFDTIFTAVAANDFDMVAAASTITPEREQVVDFSDGYYNARQALTVASDSEIMSTDDVGEGHVVGVQRGTTGKSWAEENLVPQGAELKTFQEAPDAFTDLESGGVDAVINDEPSSIAEVEGRSGLEIVEAIDTNELYGFAFSKDNPELRDAVNEALAAVIADGTYEQLFTKYFPDLPLPEEFAPSS